MIGRAHDLAVDLGLEDLQHLAGAVGLDQERPNSSPNHSVSPIGWIDSRSKSRAGEMALGRMLVDDAERHLAVGGRAGTWSTALDGAALPVRLHDMEHQHGIGRVGLRAEAVVGDDDEGPVAELLMPGKALHRLALERQADSGQPWRARPCPTGRRSRHAFGRVDTLARRAGQKQPETCSSAGASAGGGTVVIAGRTDCPSSMAGTWSRDGRSAGRDHRCRGSGDRLIVHTPSPVSECAEGAIRPALRFDDGLCGWRWATVKLKALRVAVRCVRYGDCDRGWRNFMRHHDGTDPEDVGRTPVDRSIGEPIGRRQASWTPCAACSGRARQRRSAAMPRLAALRPSRLAVAHLRGGAAWPRQDTARTGRLRGAGSDWLG